MSTVFSQVAAAIVTSLQAATAVSANIYRARVKAAAAEWTNMVVVRVMDSQLERFAIKGGPFNLDTTIAIECYARGGPGISPDVAVDSLLAAVWARLATDTTLGALVSDLLATEINFEYDVDGEPTACATLKYLAIHRAQNQTLE